jgi:hypothetical protein
MLKFSPLLVGGELPPHHFLCHSWPPPMYARRKMASIVASFFICTLFHQPIKKPLFVRSEECMLLHSKATSHLQVSPYFSDMLLTSKKDVVYRFLSSTEEANIWWKRAVPVPMRPVRLHCKPVKSP